MPETPGRGYRHRAKEKLLARDGESRERLLDALAHFRQKLMRLRVRIRTLTGARNEAIAQAIEDGLRISTVAAAVGESVPRIRSVALSFEDLPQSDTAPDEHLHTLRTLALDLQEALGAKSGTEGQLGVLIGHAYRMGFTDEAHLAGLAGVPPECVRQNVRGLRRNPPI